MRLMIVRHGDPDYSIDSLTPKGWKEAELLADEKERSEHNMLVDLGRNDIGKISRIGTVEVEKYMSIERYSHVMHIYFSTSFLRSTAVHNPAYENMSCICSACGTGRQCYHLIFRRKFFSCCILRLFINAFQKLLPFRYIIPLGSINIFVICIYCKKRSCFQV